MAADDDTAPIPVARDAGDRPEQLPQPLLAFEPLPDWDKRAWQAEHRRRVPAVTVAVVSMLVLGLAAAVALAAVRHRPQAPASAPATATSPASFSTGSGLSPAERQLVALTNAQRARHGCQPLVVDDRLVRAAGEHAGDMVARHYFSHTAPDGTDHAARARHDGFPGGAATGENIAMGFSTPQAVLVAWMGSPGHRANILNCAFTVIGTGFDPGVVRPGYAAGAWVQVFGALQG